MAKEFLDRADVISAFEQVGGNMTRRSFCPFPRRTGDLAPLEIEILCSQLEAILQSEPGTVEERRHDPRHAG